MSNNFSVTWSFSSNSLWFKYSNVFIYLVLVFSFQHRACSSVWGTTTPVPFSFHACDGPAAHNITRTWKLQVMGGTLWEMMERQADQLISSSDLTCSLSSLLLFSETHYHVHIALHKHIFGLIFIWLGGTEFYWLLAQCLSFLPCILG